MDCCLIADHSRKLFIYICFCINSTFTKGSLNVIGYPAFIMLSHERGNITERSPLPFFKSTNLHHYLSMILYILYLGVNEDIMGVSNTYNLRPLSARLTFYFSTL